MEPCSYLTVKRHDLPLYIAVYVIPYGWCSKTVEKLLTEEEMATSAEWRRKIPSPAPWRVALSFCLVCIGKRVINNAAVGTQNNVASSYVRDASTLAR